MHVTAHTLAKIAGVPVNDNIVSTSIGLQMAGVGAGLERPHRLAMLLGQLSHESMGWRYDREVWGPTRAQQRYEGRKDLGNTQPGDGSRFRGRGPIQITGRANYAAFTRWAKNMNQDAPNFETAPEAVNSNPWEGLSPIWYWSDGNPTSRSLNGYADRGDYEGVTRRINGGLNGYADRQARYARAALVLIGRDPGDLRGFQRACGLAADGVAGPKTLAQLHSALAAAAPMRFRDGPPVQDAEPAKPRATVGLAALITAIFKAIFGGK